jgi:uncharacterized protein YdhG (YjbR/CyaY superfamily)
MSAPASVEAYIASFPPEVGQILEQIRRVTSQAAPDATEAITYGIPTLMLGDRPILYFAGWKRHISIYPIPEADADLANEMARYEAGKGTLRFPLAGPMPYELIGRIAAAARRTRGR